MTNARRRPILRWGKGIAVLAALAVLLSLGVETAHGAPQTQKSRKKPPAPPPRKAADQESRKPPGETKPALNEVTRKLFMSVELNDLPAIKSSIEAGADLFAQNADGMTSADLAVDKGHFIVAHYLLSRRLLGETPPMALIPGKADKAMAAVKAKPRHKFPRPPAKPKVKPKVKPAALEPAGEPQVVAEAPSIPATPAPVPAPEPAAVTPETRGGDADKPLANQGISEFFKSLVELVTPGGEKAPKAKKEPQTVAESADLAETETVVDPDLLADGLGKPEPGKGTVAPADEGIVETVIEDPDEIVIDVTDDGENTETGDEAIVELIEEDPAQLEETGLETLTADPDLGLGLGLDQPGEKTAKKATPGQEKEEEGFLDKLARLFSADKNTGKPGQPAGEKVTGPTPEEVAAYDLPLPAPKPQTPRKFSPRFMDRLADFLEGGDEEEFKAWLPKMQVMNGGIPEDRQARLAPDKMVVERLPLPDSLKEKTPETEAAKPGPLKPKTPEPETEKGLFKGAFDKLVDVLTPDFASKDRQERVTLEPEEELAKADTKAEERKTEEAPGFWPVTKVETAEAPLIGVRKPARIQFESTALKGVTLSLGQSVSLENTFPPVGDGIDPFNRCVKKNRGTTLFCLETVDWPESLKSEFLVPTILYTGQKAIARYDQGIASRFHALFPSESFKRVAAYFHKRFGAPTDVWNRSIAPFAQPRQDNPTLAWRSIDAKTGAVTVLEIRKYDDSRGGFPDTKRGAVMLYLANTPSIFPQVSAHELMRLSRARMAAPPKPGPDQLTSEEMQSERRKRKAAEQGGAAPKVDEDSFALPPDSQGR